MYPKLLLHLDWGDFCQQGIQPNYRAIPYQMISNRYLSILHVVHSPVVTKNYVNFITHSTHYNYYVIKSSQVISHVDTKQILDISDTVLSSVWKSDRASKFHYISTHLITWCFIAFKHPINFWFYKKYPVNQCS